MSDVQESPIEAEPPVAYRARTLGEQLRLAREGRGLALADIAGRTRIPERTLAAIEADAHDQLPHPTFAAGFIRSLAREVGVSEEDATARYRAENTRLPPAPVAPPLRPIEPERVPSRSLAWGSAAVAAIAIVGAITWFGRDRSTPPPASATTTVVAASPAPVPSSVLPPTTQPGALVTPPASTTGAPASTATSPPPATATPAGTATPPPPALGTPGGAVTLTATQDVWLQVRDKASGQRLMSTTLAQGQVYNVPPGAVQLWTGRAGAIEVRVNGRLLPPLGGLAETVRKVDLDPQSLLARTAGSPPAPAR